MATRVLYIDDDEGLRRLTAKLLERHGYDVALAASGTEGVAVASGERFDLIAVDHYMPGQDGLETLAQLRALPDPPPIVYVTGSEESRIAVAALKAGASDYVVKTVDQGYIELLDQAFRQALEQVQLRGEKRLAESALRVSNERLQTLLREVNHRVSNSLALVSGFIHMQARGVCDGPLRDALMTTERRIQAIAQVHRRLYTSDDVESVAIDEYLRAIAAELEETWSTPAAARRISVSAQPIQLKTDKAVSLGVIVNELVSNACKYAYGEAPHGEVRIDLRREGDGAFVLRIEDDGCGMANGEPAQGTGLGGKLVKAMAASLGASLDYDPAHKGVRAVLRGAI